MGTLKIVLFLEAFIVLLGMLSGITYAKETIDLQRYVNCDVNYCSLSVDINELDLSSDAKTFLKNVKRGDLDMALSELPATLRNFDYYIQDKEKLIVTSDIEIGSSNYWYMEFADFILDPFFNSSYPYRQNVTLKSSNATTDMVNILVNLTFPTETLIGGGKVGGCDYVLIWDNDNDVPLNYTVEECGTNTTQYWVWIPLLKADNTTSLSFLYGNETTSFDVGASICDVGVQTWYPVNQEQIADIVTLEDLCDAHDLDTNLGDPAIETSYIRNGTDFDGDDCIKSTTDYANLSTYSVEVWVYPDDTTALDTVIIKGDVGVGAATREWTILESNSVACNGKMSFGLMSDSCSEDGEVWACSADIGTGAWHYFVGVRNTSAIQTYTDATGGTPAACTHQKYTTGDLVLGAHDCDGTADYIWDGHSDNIRIWNRALTGGEINVIYNYFTNGDMVSWESEEEWEEPPEEPPAAAEYPVSYTVCIDNKTLITNNTIIINGNANNTVVYTACDNGCDNVTFACEPSTYEASLMNFGVMLLVIFGIGLIYRYGRR